MDVRQLADWGVNMDKLENGKRYNSLVINGLHFDTVKVFIMDGNIDIVDCTTGATVARVFVNDVKMLIL